MGFTEDEAAKTRILTHMNAQHRPSLTRYLEHKSGLSAFAARSPTMTDITTAGFAIRAGRRTHIVEFHPPLLSLSESRSRLVAMDQEATEALGRAPETITTYAPPQSIRQIVTALLVLFGFVALSSRSNFLPRSWLTSTFLRPFPAVAAFCHDWQPTLIRLMIAIHAYEAWHISKTRLTPYSVPVGGKVWLAWIISTFFEGFGAFERFDALVVKERERKAKAKH